MLSTIELESLINAKRHEIMKEKTLLGLMPAQELVGNNDKENTTPTKSNSNSTTTSKNSPVKKRVKFANALKENNEATNDARSVGTKQFNYENNHGQGLEEPLHAELERYIRRYLGLPVMLKTGEYSPNNPLVRGSIPRDRDVFLGLGEYEQRSKTLRRLRQKEYKEYLDQQAKKKQEEKQQAERERRLRDEREQETERLQLERDNAVPLVTDRLERDSYSFKRLSETHTCPVYKVDTGVQCDRRWKMPLSVGVQTEEADFFELATKNEHLLTQAERELSPRTVINSQDERPINPAVCPAGLADTERTSNPTKSNRDKLHSDLKHSYIPSIFDADAIQLRNAKAQQEAAKRRKFYQQDLKHQIEEQQRIKEERRAREKMLELAEMRRLEEQLKMLRVATEKETWKNELINTSLKENTAQFNKKRLELQKEIEEEQKKTYHRAASQPSYLPTRNIYTSKSDNSQNVPPRFHVKAPANHTKPAFSTQDNMFSPNYDVDNYLRKNLNPSKESLLANQFQRGCFNQFQDTATKTDSKLEHNGNNRRYSFAPDLKQDIPENTIVEKALIHEPPKSQTQASSYEPSFLKKDINDLIVKDTIDTLPIPVLRHSPKTPFDSEEWLPKANSEAMQKVEEKWKVPVVQKNILKAMPSAEIKNGSILTQLGSIRRQLQLEQLRLDKLTNKSDG